MIEEDTLVRERVLQEKPSTRMIRSFKITAPHTIEVVEKELPEPGMQEIRVKMEGCGISASNLAAWQGRPSFQGPFHSGMFGCEGYGIVDKVGKNVKQIKRGDRITGMFDDAFAEYTIARANEVVQIPEALKSIPLPGEPLGCAINIFRRSKIRSHQHVAIVGVGFLGALLIQLTKCVGAKVYAISRRPYSLQIATDMGADEVIQIDDSTDVEQRILELTHGNGCDCVIEASGHQPTLDLATSIVRTNGRLVIAGYHREGVRHVNLQTWNWKGIDVINAHERDVRKHIRGTHAALEAIVDCQLDITPLLTHYYSPDQLNDAFETMSLRPDGFVKAIVLFN